MGRQVMGGQIFQASPEANLSLDNLAIVVVGRKQADQTGGWKKSGTVHRLLTPS